MPELIEYPVKKEIKAEGKPVVLNFSVSAHFGTHDKSEEGEILSAIIDKDGTAFELDESSANWEEIFPGLEKKYEISYSGNMRESVYSIRIQPEACPITLHVKSFHEYSASDYPHHIETHEKYYSTLITK
jgi:hypothetical protein